MKLNLNKSDKTFIYSFAVPVGILVILIGFVPIIYSFILSLTDYSLIERVSNFIGLDNYIRLFTDNRFIYSIIFTIVFGLVAVGLELIAGFTLAYVLADRDVSSKFSSVMRTIMMVPFIVAPVAVAFTYKNLIYHPFSGYLNYLLGLLHLPKFIMFDGRWNGIIAIMIVEVIVRTPFMLLILYAGITSVPDSILEAAEIDGANMWDRLFKVIIPYMKPVIIVACVFRYMSVLKIFDEIYVMTQGGPGTTTENISLFASAQAFNYFHTAYSAASTFIFFVVVMVLINIFLKVGKFGAE